MIMKMMTILSCLLWPWSWSCWQGVQRPHQRGRAAVPVDRRQRRRLAWWNQSRSVRSSQRGFWEVGQSLYWEVGLDCTWSFTRLNQCTTWKLTCSDGAMPVPGLVILSLLLAGWFIITDIAINHHYHHHHVRLWQYWGYSCWTQQMLLNSGESFLHNHGLYNFVGPLHSVSTLNSLFLKFKYLLIFVNLRCINIQEVKILNSI